MAIVTLSRPIVRGDTTVAVVTLHEPEAGALRGLKLGDLALMDVSSLIRLVPRISDPHLTEAEVARMGMVDISRLGVAVAGFINGVPETGPDTPTT